MYYSTNLGLPRDIYFVKQQSSGWSVTCNTGSLVSYSYENKKDALDTAKILASKYQADVIVEESSGNIEKKLSYR
jgi:hypothetical protein